MADYITFDQFVFKELHSFAGTTGAVQFYFIGDDCVMPDGTEFLRGTISKKDNFINAPGTFANGAFTMQSGVAFPITRNAKNPSVTFTAVIVDEKGVQHRTSIEGFFTAEFMADEDGVITQAVLNDYNSQPMHVPGPETLETAAFSRLVQNITRPLASNLTRGESYLSEPPVDPARPVAVGDNDPRNTNLWKQLASVGPRYINLLDYDDGSLGGGGDNSVVAQAALSAMTSGSVLVFPPGLKVLAHGLQTPTALRNVRIQCLQPSVFNDLNVSTQLVYNGAAGGDLLTCNEMRDSIIEGIGFFASNSAGSVHGARRLLRFAQANLAASISSRNTARRCSFDLNSQEANAIGVSFDNTSGVNNEAHTLDDCTIRGLTQTYGSRIGAGVYLGHSNVKQIKLNKVSFVGLATGVNGAGGSFRGRDCVWSGVDTMLGGYFSDAISLTGDDVEDVISIVNAGGFGQVPFSLIAGERFNDIRGGQAVTATTTNTPVFNFPTVGGGNLLPTIIGCTFAALGNAAFTSDFIKDASAAGAGGSLSLNWLGNALVNTPIEALLSAFNTFRGGFAVDQYGKPVIFGKQNSGGMSQLSLDAALSNGARTPLIRIYEDTNNGTPNFTQPGTLGALQLADSVLEIQRVPPVMDLSYSLAGATGATRRVLRAVPLDANGNQSNSSNEIDIPNANATLSGVNKIIATCTHSLGAASYDVIERNTATGNTYRLVMNQAASGTGRQTFEITSNPSGAYSYTFPAYNRTALTLIRGGLRMQTLPTYANNAAAIAGGLLAGDLYRTGGDPDLICIVH